MEPVKTKLRAWMDKTGTSGAYLGKVLCCTDNAVYKWANGEGRPRYERAVELAALTDGAVTVDDLMTLDAPAS